MNENLTKKTQEWMQLERKTIEQRKIAEAFYDKELMQLIADDYIERNKEKVYEKVPYLIISVGTSYEPIVLNIGLLNPDKILFLYTKQSEKILDKIVNFTSLNAARYEKRMVNETDPLDIYREIKRTYMAWEKPDKVYVDFTGGTKAMSAAAAMAGAMINIQLVYVGTNDYLADFRKPNPGSETLFYIENPLAVFGDMEIDKAVALMSEKNYAGSAEMLKSLGNSIPDPEIRQQLKFAWLLSKTYEAWDSLDFIPAYDYSQQLCRELQRDKIHRNYLMMDLLEPLKKQGQLLKILKNVTENVKMKKNPEILKDKQMITALMFTMYQNGMIREEQMKYDMATLLFYRLLEMIEQRRLSNYSLFVSDMDYPHMKVNTKACPEFAGASDNDKLDILKKKTAEIKMQLFGRPGNPYLPEQVSLLEGFIILYALKDPIIYTNDDKKYTELKKIRSMVFLRNNSIFAHGLGPVKSEDYQKFRDYVEEMLKKFCAIEKISFEEMRDSMHWYSPYESVNYSANGGI